MFKHSDKLRRNREVFVTNCKIDKITVIGDSSKVKIRDENQATCGKYIYPNTQEKDKYFKYYRNFK